MANNVELNLGSGGSVVALEDVAGVKYQQVKLIDGTPASTTPIGTAANPLRIDPTGSTTQPVSAASLPLPEGAATAAKQDTGNTSLATIAAKDFATQTTLSALNAKVIACDTGAVVISSGVITSITNAVAVTGTFFQATQPVSGTVTGQATATAAVPAYTEAAASNLSQDLTGHLRTRIAALVSEAVPVYIDGDVKPLSLNSEGRLRVSVVPAPEYMEFFEPFNFGGNVDVWAISPSSPWSALQ